MEDSELNQSRDQCTLRGARAVHFLDVLKSKVGDRVRVGLPRHSQGSAEILERTRSKQENRVELGNFQLEAVTRKPTLRLVVALPRPKALLRLLETAASFGVDHIDLLNAWRVSKSYWNSPSIEPARLQQQLRLGCEQGRHVWLPSITTHRFLMPFLDQDFSARQCLLAHPGSGKWLNDCQLQTLETLPLTLAFGPEGGWIAKELASFADAGWEHFTLSDSILRTEIAVASALSQVELLSRG